MFLLRPASIKSSLQVLLPKFWKRCVPGMYLAILCDLFGVIKWPVEMVKWPPIRGWKGHFEPPGIIWECFHVKMRSCEWKHDVVCCSSEKGDRIGLPWRWRRFCWPLCLNWYRLVIEVSHLCLIHLALKYLPHFIRTWLLIATAIASLETRTLVNLLSF